MRTLLLLIFLALGAPTLLLGQSRQINGTVTDADGTPLPGVSISVSNTTHGTSSNDDGSFTLTIPTGPDVTLQVSYLGYLAQEGAVGTRQVLTIVMEPDDAAMLDEVVAVGYGTVRKGDLTGSGGSVSAEALTARCTTSVLGAVQVGVAGVDISSNSVRPGGGFSIQIRGQNSLEGGNPLYVVDGVVTSNIDFLNPADIEKIDVLKDASSTAIYGSRGSNGVVIVKTKNAGTPGVARTTVTYDGYYGVREFVRIPDFMDGREWVDFRTSAYYAFENGEYVLPNRNVILQESPLLERRLYEENYEDWL